MVNHKIVQNAYNFPTGYYYDSISQTIIVATQATDDNMKPLDDFKFYYINPKTAEAKFIGKISKTNENDHYAGWVS